MQRPRVVLVEDVSEILDCCSEILKQDFEVVSTVSDGRAAIGLCAGTTPDVVELDICLPGLSVIETASRLLSSWVRKKT